MAHDILFVRQIVSILTDPLRLKLVGLLTVQEFSLEELASVSGLGTSRVAQHLRKLEHLGLVELQPAETQVVAQYRLNARAFHLLIASWHASHPSFASDNDIPCDERVFDEREREIIRRYFRGPLLTTIPAGQKHLEVIVRWFAQLFEVGICYQEHEVNQVIQRHYHDYAFF